MNSVPQFFAEYNSMNSSGAPINLGSRRSSYSKDGTSVALNPVLSTSEAAQYTIENMFGAWRPRQYTKQVTAPVIAQTGQTITWDNAPNARCWAVFGNGQYLDNVTNNSYDISGLTTGDEITVRAANEMGGLGPASNTVIIAGTDEH